MAQPMAVALGGATYGATYGGPARYTEEGNGRFGCLRGARRNLWRTMSKNLWQTHRDAQPMAQPMVDLQGTPIEETDDLVARRVSGATYDATYGATYGRPTETPNG